MSEITRYVGFQAGAAFPADSVVAQFLARICTVTNDLMLTQENTGLEYSRSDRERHGVPLHYLYSACAYYREAAKLLSDDLQKPEITAFVSQLHSDAQTRLQRLRESFTPWKGSFVEAKLRPLRDQIFHYPRDTELKEALTRTSNLQTGIDLGRGSYLETRYDFADELISSLAVKALGEDREELQRTLERVASLMIDYIYFTHAAVTHYLKSLPKDILDLQVKTV